MKHMITRQEIVADAQALGLNVDMKISDTKARHYYIANGFGQRLIGAKGESEALMYLRGFRDGTARENETIMAQIRAHV